MFSAGSCEGAIKMV